MSFLMRLARLLRADAHSLLDELEQPVSILRQSLREMGDIIARNEATLGDLLKQQVRVQDDRDRQSDGMVLLGDQLRVCLEAGDDRLARTVIRRRLQGQRRLDQYDRTIADLARQRERLDKEVASQRTRMTELQEQADEALRCSELEHSVAFYGAQSTESMVSDAEIDVALLAEKRRYAASGQTEGA